MLRVKRDLITKRDEDRAYREIQFADDYWNAEWYLVRSLYLYFTSLSRDFRWLGLYLDFL